MNKLKKLLSAIVAAATLLVGTAFPVSADYDSYDVNRDGVVSPADLVQLNKYLCGSYSVTNYNLLDVNKSLTVDAADAECLRLRVLGYDDYSSGYFSRETGTVVSPPTVSGFTPSESSSSSVGREYRRCRYNNGQPESSSESYYTLTPSLMTLPETNPRKVFGKDERKVSCNPENSGIVYLEGIGTGFIVGDHQIATAAHCVYGSSGWYSMSIKTYDSNGNITNNTLHPVEAHIPKSYRLAGPNEIDHMYDYALITVSDDLSDCVQFSLGTPYNVSATAYSNIPVYVTGYPGDKYDETGVNCIYSAEGSVMDKNSYLSKCTDIVCYNVDTARGQSGSPVYTITKIGNEYVYTAIAVHHGGLESCGQNWGSMITNYHLQFYKNNPNASYSAN